ncbi:MAG: 50S ribosomal protein L24 [Gammaproteobacteria bacterium]|nr:MAG: 50S ribosomal protein L24 [Gammaproteobacteria bacterium]
MQKIRKGDDVIVLSGKDKGKRGVVLRAMPDRQRVVVENVNTVKRHTKPNPNRGAGGGIVEKEMPLHVSNVALYNPVSKKGERAGVRVLEDGRKVRYFRSNNEVIDK